MELRELIRNVRASLRSDSAREIHDALTRPQSIRTPRKVELQKSAEDVTWELLAIAEIETFLETVTGSKADALKRIAALNSMQMLQAVRAGKKAKPEKAEDIGARSEALVLLYLDAQRRGYEWPLPDHFGKHEMVVDTVDETNGPSIFETNFPGVKLPTVEEVAGMME